jgi:predicted AlkP superfamily phosphohydrolase/phosphomutase
MSQSATAKRTTQRLLMLGLDSASLPFIREHLGNLPVLESLLSKGSVQELESTATYFSASVWPTFSSGKQPGEHGQYFPFQWSEVDHSYRRLADPRWSEELDFEPFWHRIANAGIPTIAFDIAHTLHDERAPCLQITNWSYQSLGTAGASDPKVLKEIRRRFGYRPIGHEVPVPKTARQCVAIRDQLVRAACAKADATLYLMEKPWCLFVTGWYEAHRAGHNLWPVDGEFASDAAPDALLAVYKEIDRQLGRVLARLEAEQPATSVMLFSLHGMSENRAQDHFLNEILARLNSLYLGRQRNRSKKPAIMNMMALLRHVVPATMQYRAATLLGDHVRNWVVRKALTGGRDWAASPSFPVHSGGEGLIRMNIKGRESTGFFEPESAELADYVAWLRERLLAIEVSGTGERLIDEIVAVDDVFTGERRHFLPDLILKWRPLEPVDRIRSADIGEIEFSIATGRGGNHNDSAFLAATGDDSFRKIIASARRISDLGLVAQEYLLSRG